jgi:hypothetical protein
MLYLRFVRVFFSEGMVHIWLKIKALATRHDVLEANAFSKKKKCVQFLSMLQ